MSDKKIWSPEEKEQLARSSLYEKCKEYKDKVCGKNARGKVIEKLEFIGNV